MLFPCAAFAQDASPPASADSATESSTLAAAQQLIKARLAESRGDFRTALEAYAEAVRLDPRGAYLRLEYGRLLATLGQRSRDPGERRRRFGLAREQLAAIEALNPTNPELWKEVGLLYLDLSDGSGGNINNARSALETVREQWPEDPEILVPLGQIYRATGDLKRAVEALRTSVESVPGNPWVRSLLERVLVDAARDDIAAGASESAGELLREALKLEPTNPDALSLLSDLASQRGEHAEAVALLRRIAPQDLRPELSRRLVWELFQAGDVDAAARVADSMELGEDDSTRSLKILLYAARGDLDRAADELATLVGESARHAVVAGALGQALTDRGQGEQARDLLGRVADRLATDPDADSGAAARIRLEMAELAAANGDWDAVQEALEPLAAGALGHAPHSSEGGSSDGAISALDVSAMGEGWKLLYADALLELGRAEEALDLLPSSLPVRRPGPKRPSDGAVDGESDSEPGQEPGDEDSTASPALSPAALVAKRAEILLELGAEDEGERVMEGLTRAEDVETLLAAARTYQRMERYASAIPLLERVVVLDEGSLEGLYFLASAYERTGELDRSVTTFRKVLKVEPDFAPALNYLGYLWAERGENLAEALSLVNRAVSLDPTNGAYVDSLGWAHYQLGNYAEALDQLERAARLLPNDATIFEHLGDVYVALGRLDLAEQVYERSLELEDENADTVRRKLESLSDQPPGR